MTMNINSWQRLLLPLTIVTILMVFTEKAATLARAETGTTEVTPSAPAEAKRARTPDTSAAISLDSPPAPVVPPAELSLLSDLRKRREALDARSKALDQRADLLAVAELKLDSKLDQLAALQARLQQMEQDRQRREAANWAGLVKTYEDMKPRDAATIFNVLDSDVLIEVLDRMDERKAAAVLASMLPERARQATQMLAHKRLQESASGSPQQQDPGPAEHHG